MNQRNQWQVSASHADLVRAALPPRPLPLAANPEPITIDLTRTRVIVIDMQNGFCLRDGWLASIGVDITPARAPIAPLAALLPKLCAAGVPVIWVNRGASARTSSTCRPPCSTSTTRPATAPPWVTNSKKPVPPILQAGSWTAGIVDELTPPTTDIHVAKHRISGFWDTALDSILRNTLLSAGVNLDQCVLHSLADANFLGYDTILLEDCAATTNPDFCREATLLNIRQIFGFTVTSAALLESLPA